MLSRLILQYIRLVRRRIKLQTLAIRFDKNSINFRAIIIAAYDDTNLLVVVPMTRRVVKQRLVILRCEPRPGILV